LARDWCPPRKWNNPSGKRCFEDVASIPTVARETILKTRLITFGDGNRHFQAAVRRVVSQAESFQGIDGATGYFADNLPPDYAKTFRDFPARFPRGYGLWSWKPFLVHHVLAQLDAGDVLIYLDAGSEINALGQGRFQEYLSNVQDQKALFFQMENAHGDWTKDDPLLVSSDAIAKRGQIAANCFMVSKTQENLEFMRRWLELCAANDGDLLKDPDPSSEQRPEFKAHRHDQSCLSRMVFDADYCLLPDETWSTNFQECADKPFLSLRNKTGRSKIHKIFPVWQRPAIFARELARGRGIYR